MLHVERGPYQVDVDVNATHKAYKRLPELACECAGCRNYLEAVPHAPEALHAFLQELGIDIRKPAEIGTYAQSGGNMPLVQYGGSFPLIGEFPDGFPSGAAMQGDAFVFRVGEATLAFREGPSVAEGFPKHAIRLEVFTWLPWLLEEERAAQA